MSNNITTPSLKFAILEEGKSSLADAYVVCVQADSVDAKVRSAQANVWDIVRWHAVTMYREFLVKSGNDVSKIDTKALVGAFLLKMEEAEKQYSEYELPRAWTNYKSKLKLALEKGYNLHDNSTVGFNKVTTFLKEEREKSEAQNDEQNKQAARDAGHSSEGAENNSSTETEASNTEDNLLAGLSDKVQTEILAIISVAQKIEKSESNELSEKLANILNGATGMLQGCHVRALSILAGEGDPEVEKRKQRAAAKKKAA